ncbi:chromatin assembly factor 1 subunit C [Histoplasma capsulatum H143]|uniref:Chromatin assembly factor 1 subunit C n=1 Tax=Ajellomyces capsulatus (strain H143) TaxID=544712 RepID=C6HE88_AJECH|nr:chromatin assembly factor 1 subunit C [Histoplasma capsulatum H143]
MDDYDQVGIEEEQEEERTEEKIINEEYKTWKKNAPFLYDMILSTALEWPTLTTQWLPDKQALPDKPYSTHRLLIGTHTSSDAQNYLQIAHVQLPNPTAPDAEDYDDERGEIGGYGGGGSKKAPMEVKFNIVQKIDHKGEVNKARYQPQNPNVIAHVHQDEIWVKLESSFGGHLVTGSEDKTVRLWDITQHTKGNKALRPSRTYTHHSSIVNDVQYHPLHSSLIGTVSDDITLQIIDDREADTTRAAAVSRDQHKDAINAIAFNPAKETVLATGSADKSVGIWDLRNLKSKLHALECHNESVTSLAWHPLRKRCCQALAMIGRLCSGISVALARSRRLKMLRMGHLSYCLCTVDIPTASPTSAGT